VIVINDYDMGKIFQEIELRLIRSMKRTLKPHKDWELTEGFDWPQWQVLKLRELRSYRRRNMAIMSSYKLRIDKATKDHLIKQYLEAGSKVDKEVQRAIKKGFRLAKQAPNDAFFKASNRKLDTLVKAVSADMKRAQTATLRMMDDVYRQTLYKSEVFFGSGAGTLDQAVDMATKDFLRKGITAISYSNGSSVNVASYSRMSIRTANRRAYLTGEGERRKEWGISTVLISQYLGCSDICSPWQGRVYIDDVYSGGKAEDGDYPLLSEAINEGLFHPNCKHTSSTFFPGINEEPEIIQEDELGDRYEKAQRENEINRNVQKYKRLKEGSLDPSNIKKYDAKMKEWKMRSKFLNNQNVKPIAKAVPDGIINNKKWLEAEFSSNKKLKNHIDKHLKEFEGISEKEYIIKAKELLAADISESIEGFVDKDGFVFKYNNKTNDFAIGRPDGKISTLYKPIDKLEYWKGERIKHEPKN